MKIFASLIFLAAMGASAQVWNPPTAGSGTVTSVTFTGDGVVDSSTPSTAVTTSGTVTATISTQSANLLLAGPTTGSAAAPTFRALVNADFPGTLAPTFSGANLTSLPAAAAGTLTGATLAAGVTASSLTSLGGGTVGTAAFVNTGTSGGTVPLLNGANTYSGASTFSAAVTASAAGASSTPGVTVSGTPFVGSGTTSTPQLYINNGTAPTTWNSSATGGTYLGINGQSGFAGNYIDVHTNGGASVFSVNNTGGITGSTGSFSGGAFSVNSGSISGKSFATASNCTSSASPAVCASAAAGTVVVAASGTTVQVNTTAVTANSIVIVQEDSSLGTKLSVTCNTTPATAPPTISARTGGTSFTITTTAPSTNPRCFSYFVID